MGTSSFLPILRSYSITDKFKIFKYKFIQINGIVFVIFLFIYSLLYKLDKEFHFNYDKSYNMTSVIDVIYFTIATQTTIGYGDITPRSKLAKICMIIHISSVIILLGIATS
jgi:hypothetical protein